MTVDDETEDRRGTKRDRLARMTRLMGILQAHPDGMRTADLAERVGMSVRTVYRDLKAIDDEIVAAVGRGRAVGHRPREARSCRRSS